MAFVFSQCLNGICSVREVKRHPCVSAFSEHAFLFFGLKSFSNNSNGICDFFFFSPEVT